MTKRKRLKVLKNFTEFVKKLYAKDIEASMDREFKRRGRKTRPRH